MRSGAITGATRPRLPAGQAFTPAAPGRVQPLGASTRVARDPGMTRGTLAPLALLRGRAASHQPAARWRMAYYSPSPPLAGSTIRRRIKIRALSRPGTGGPDGIRTRDLLNAIEARSQLRYGPTISNQWSRPDSNRRPLPCERSALPAELRPHRHPSFYPEDLAHVKIFSGLRLFLGGRP